MPDVPLVTTAMALSIAKSPLDLSHTIRKDATIDGWLCWSNGERMQRIFLKILAGGLLLNFAAYAQQSLGDIARENRDKQAAEQASGVQPRVITNKDLPQGSDLPSVDPSTLPPAKSPMASNGMDQYRSPEQRMAEQRMGEQWRGRIEAQQSRIDNLQARIDRLNAAIRATGGTVQYDQPHSRYEAMAQERVAEMQRQLDEQRFRLEQMQEAARRAGMHTSVYDP